MIYFDNAATTQMSQAALEALINVSKENYGNASSIYSYGRKSKKILDESRRIVADCIGAEPEEIYFTSGGTESDNWAVSQVISHNIHHIITSQVEHHAILNPIRKLEEKGMQVTYLPVNNDCVIDIESLREELIGNKIFVSLMYQNNETGTIQKIKQAAQMVHESNPESIFHTDAVQAIGHMKIDVKDLGVDMLSASAHKFNGPKGIGFLYVRRGLHISSMIEGGGQEFGLRSGTESVASIFSMAKALQDNIERIDLSIQKQYRMEKRLFTLLSEAGIHYNINGDNNRRAAGIVNISINSIDAEGLLNALDMHDICVSIGSACNSKSKISSYVLSAMGINKDRIDSSIRISMGRFNLESDVDQLVYRIDKYYKLTAGIS